MWSAFVSLVMFFFFVFFIHQIWSQLCSPRGGTKSERESWKQKWGATMQTVCVRVFGSSQPEISHRRNKTCSFLLLHDCSSMTPHPSSSSQLLLLLLLTQEELFLSCCDGLSSLSLVTETGSGRTLTFFEKTQTNIGHHKQRKRNDLWGSNQSQQRMWSCDLDLLSPTETKTHECDWMNVKIQTILKKTTWTLQWAADSLLVKLQHWQTLKKEEKK